MGVDFKSQALWQMTSRLFIFIARLGSYALKHRHDAIIVSLGLFISKAPPTGDNKFIRDISSYRICMQLALRRNKALYVIVELTTTVAWEEGGFFLPNNVNLSKTKDTEGRDDHDK